MRKLMWFAIGFTAACAAGAYFVCGIWLLLVALFCLLGGVALAFGKSFWQKVAMLALLGCAAGFLWMFGFDRLFLSVARTYNGETVKGSVLVSDYGYDTAYGTTADGEMELNGRTYRVRLYLDKAKELSPGDRVDGEFLLQYTGSREESKATYHQGKGIFLLAYNKDAFSVSRNAKTPMRFLAADLRRNITNIMDSLFPEDTLGFARALLLGDSSLLTYEEETAFRTSGIRHVIAVSGLHVSILFSLVYMLVGKRRYLTAILGIPVLMLFAAVAGFTPSINRACIMQSLMILALLFDREYDPPTALSFAVLVMLFGNPLTVTSVSFQLSAGCMVGIFLFSQRISGYILRCLGSPKSRTLKGKLCRWFAGSVSVTLSAMAVTTPLCAIYFQSVSLIGILTNLLTLWVISFIFYGIMLSLIAGAIWLPAGRCVAWLISLPIRFVLAAAKILGSVPLAAVYTASVYVVMWLIFSYILFAVFLFSKKKHPVLLASCVVVLLALCVLCSWVEPRLDSYRLTVLDVGQGQCILLQVEDRHYIVDCGGDTDAGAADIAAQWLLSQGITRIDGLILTHYDRDHAGGVAMLLSRIPADTLYLPDVADDKNIRKVLTEQYSHQIQWIQPETVTKIHGADITIFAAEKGKTDNESSLCILFQPNNCDILITGDRSTAGESKLLEQTKLPELDVLIVGHHGAKSSTGIQLLAKTNPEIAVISVGRDNSYGLPSQQVLYLLSLFDCRVLRTDRDGTILIRG